MSSAGAPYGIGETALVISLITFVPFGSQAVRFTCEIYIRYENWWGSS